MKYDYTDMFDIVSFFDGPPDGGAHPSQGRKWVRDGLAEEIAENGRKFAMERMRWVLPSCSIGVGGADPQMGRHAELHVSVLA